MKFFWWNRHFNSYCFTFYRYAVKLGSKNEQHWFRRTLICSKWKVTLRRVSWESNFYSCRGHAVILVILRRLRSVILRSRHWSVSSRWAFLLASTGGVRSPRPPLLLLFRCYVVSESLRPHGQQHSRLLCPPLSPRACSNSCPLHQWFHPITPSSAVLFSFCPQSLPASWWAVNVDKHFVSIMYLSSAFCRRGNSVLSFS